MVAHVSELVCNTREGSTEPGWAHLSELDGDNAPRALHAELYTERASGKRLESARQDPKRNESSAQQDKQDDCKPTTDVLRYRACDGSAPVARRANE
jgi:hypothetical protein